MRDTLKDQEQIQLTALIEKKAWKDVDDFLNGLQLEKPLKLYNKAFVYYHREKPIQALRLLEKAKYSGYLSENSTNAINMIKEELEILHIENEFSLLEKSLLGIKSMPTDFTPAVGSVFLITALGFVFLRKYIIASFLSLGVIGAFGVSLYIGNYKMFYNLEEETVYKGPSKIFEPVQILPRGLKVIFTKSDADWKYIEYPSAYQGWVYQPKVLNK